MENYIILRAGIESNLNDMFEKECPPLKQSILTTKEEIIDEFSKWYIFWDSKCPHLDKDFDFNFNDIRVHLILIKKEICERRKVAILNELKKIGLHDEFIDHMTSKNI